MGTTNHFQNHVEYDAKTIRLVNGSRIESTAPYIFDHFAYGAGAFNSHVPQNFVTTTGAGATAFAPGATGGTYIIGATDGTTDISLEIAGKLVGWVPSTMGTNMNLVFEARAKFVGTTTATAGDFYMGFNDAVTEANSRPYVFGLTSALTTHAPSDFVGFAYSSIPTSGALYSASGNLIGAITTKADVDTVTASSKVKDSDFHVYRIEITSAGHAHFFYDGEKVMTVASAVTAATALTPYLSVVCKDSKVHTATLDYIYVGGGLI